MAADRERQITTFHPSSTTPRGPGEPNALPLWGLGVGLAMGIGLGVGCATSDQMLERRQLEEGGTECRPGIEEDCYSGPEGSLGRGACKTGRRTCNDDGTLGQCTGQLAPSAELCNNLDDDCDGIVDNGFERDGALCEFATAKGICRTQGKWHCSADGTKSECDAVIIQPQAETCDGLDNDCNGQVDDNSVPQDQLACTTGKAGVCSAGTNTCINSKIRCVQNVQPGPEICNGFDDNCNNQIDDDCVQG